MVSSSTTRRPWVWTLGAILSLSALGALWVFQVPTVPPPDLVAARAALQAQRWDDVQERLSPWNASHPDDGDTAVLLGLALLNLGRPGDALSVLNRIPDRHPSRGQAQAILGEAALQRHDLPEAERNLRAALKHDPKADPPRDRLIYLLSLQQRHGEARAQLWERYQVSKDPRILCDLVDRLWTHEDDVRGLVPEIETCFQATPNDPFLRRASGLALLYQGKPAEALPLLVAAAVALENDPAGRFALAECQLALGRFQGDLDSLGPRPEDPATVSRWRVFRSRLAEAVGRPVEALENLQAAVDALPGDREAQFRLGHLLARQGDQTGATTHLNLAESIERLRLAAKAENKRALAAKSPPDAALSERLARLCVDAGLIDEARAWADRARSLDPSRGPLPIPEGKTLAFLPFPSRKLGPSTIPPALTASVHKSVRFEDVTERSGVLYRYDSGASTSQFLADTIGGGVGMLDFDQDGLLDLYFVNGCPLPVDPGRPPAPNRLYRNTGGFQFEDVTDRARVGGKGFGMGCAVGDYDGDGDPDLVVTGVTATLLYRNNGDGTFEDVSERSGIRSDRWTTAAGFADLDEDGDLDLVVIGYVSEDFSATRDCRDAAGHRIHCSPKSYPAVADHLFRNNGDGTFTDVAAEAGFDAREGRGLGMALADFDGDGRLDIYVANDTTDDFLFRNLGDLKFEEIGQLSGLATDGEGRATASMGTVAEDLDGDGRVDLIHTNLLNESTTLHRNEGAGLFRDATLDSGLRAPSRSRTGFGIAAFDADRDGKLDLFVANGHVDDQPSLNSPMAQIPQFFFGEEGGHFRLSDPELSLYLSGRVVGRGLSVGDLDNDGRVDVVIVHRDVPAVVLRNVTPGGHWLGLTLLGNSEGALVTLKAGGRKINRRVSGGTGYLGPNDPRILFGLGEATRFDSLEVRWLSGRTESREGNDGDRYMLIQESEAR